MMIQTRLSDSGMPPTTVCAYIEDMLMELAELARRIGEAQLAPQIEAAAALAHRANLRRQENVNGD